MTDKIELARKVFHNMSPYEAVDYTCTAIASLEEHDDLPLCYNSSRQVVKNFIIETLIVNEITNGFRDEETGELIYGEVKYGVIG